VDPDPGERKHDSHQMSVASDQIYDAYALRAQSVFEDVGTRVANFGFLPVTWVYDSWGFFGAGVGTGSQGMQHFGGWDLVNNGAAEAGLGKIMLELGVPGLFVMAWLGYSMLRYVNRILDHVV